MSSLRHQLAVASLRSVNVLSRVLGKGQGTVAGGAVGLRLDPSLLSELCSGRRTVLVSGTNGKTTTTALLTAALRAGGGAVVSNSTGSNMPAGHVAALAGTSRSTAAVLEVDEGYLPRVLDETRPAVVALLNLSRDQLDRMSEVRMLAGRWRSALRAAPETVVVANADDPLVTWAAGEATQVVWVAGGLAWREDAIGCPACASQLHYEEGSWACVSCDLARPTPGWSREGTVLRSPDAQVELELAIPGEFNLDNALVALAVAGTLGVPLATATRGMAEVRDVAGRFVRRTLAGVSTRLMLAKNPAGWAALLELAAADVGPVVVAINARTADGLDPSWLWDVDFTALRGRAVVVAGERWRDLSVRLRYAEVPHGFAPGLVSAVVQAGHAGGPVDVIGNYTAFSDLLAAT